MQDLPKSANDLVEGIPRFPTMLSRIREERFLISARFSFFFETFGQGSAYFRQKIGQLLVSVVAGKPQFRLPSGRFIPSIANLFGRSETKRPNSDNGFTLGQKGSI